MTGTVATHDAQKILADFRDRLVVRSIYCGKNAFGGVDK